MLQKFTRHLHFFSKKNRDFSSIILEILGKTRDQTPSKIP